MDFYSSEKRVLEELDFAQTTKIIDVGCACGGLGNALKERFGIVAYTGMDISRVAIEVGRRMHPWQDLRELDFLDLPESENEKYELVISLSCIDWNVEVLPMFMRLWQLCKQGGSVVLSARLTPATSSLTIEESYQFVNFEGRLEGEVAPYVVHNASQFLRLVSDLPGLGSVYAHGYWGQPSVTAVTPYDKLVFAVFRLTKELPGSRSEKSFRLEIPSDVL